MDLKTLFHNPEELTNDDLRHLHDKIRFQHFMPRTSALFSGFAMYLLDRHILRRGHSWLRIGGVAAAGYIIGVYATDNVVNSLNKEFDEDIIQAFDQRYLKYALNSTGFGNNYVSIAELAEDTSYKKPY